MILRVSWHWIGSIAKVWRGWKGRLLGCPVQLPLQYQCLSLGTCHVLNLKLLVVANLFKDRLSSQSRPA